MHEQLGLVKIIDIDVATSTDAPRDARQVDVIPNKEPMAKEKILREYRDLLMVLIVCLESIILKLIRIILL